LAIKKLREIKMRLNAANDDYDGVIVDEEFEIHYQEPLHFGVLLQ